jgi:hypothetical protein
MRTLVAILVLSPALLHAQAHTQAQPVSTPTLQASLTRPVVASRTQPATEAPAAPVAAVFTDAKILRMAPLTANTFTAVSARPLCTVVLDVFVDETGKAVNATVLDSTDPLANSGVIETVKESRFEPATVNGLHVASHLKLIYNIKRSEDN